MNIRTRIMLTIIGIPLMLGGCSGKNSTNNNKDSEITKETQAAASEETMVSVQDYTGEGYALPYGKETNKIADDHLAQIEEAALNFFKEKYKTDVTVHNVVGAKDGATVFVESKGEPHFYTYAVVPIDAQGKKVKTEMIWADEFQVENAIKGGLYHMIFNEEFKKLDNYLESVAAYGQVTGKTEEALQNAGGQGFMAPYYFISMTDEADGTKDNSLEQSFPDYIIKD
ncbi:DUF1672 domain-containing protein [Cytobacillus firmus]|uniref:DUF1672 family protein n=1 Tax=Cytobacillus firmus TaxID=1399 RepID=UPI0018CF519B|nr:DUF1672 family protein [Cytobacillus firmus]